MKNTDKAKFSQKRIDRALLSCMHIGAMLLKAEQVLLEQGQNNTLMESDAQGLADAIEILKKLKEL